MDDISVYKNLHWFRSMVKWQNICFQRTPQITFPLTWSAADKFPFKSMWNVQVIKSNEAVDQGIHKTVLTVAFCLHDLIISILSQFPCQVLTLGLFSFVLTFEFHRKQSTKLRKVKVTRLPRSLTPARSILIKLVTSQRVGYQLACSSPVESGKTLR